ELAKNKVITLANIISEYTGNITIHIIPFTHIQEEIHKRCKPEYMITLMRRIMMRISERIAKNNGLKAIITGESLAQVASQTIESMTVTNAVIEDLPVLRPLIGMDKEDIIAISKKIRTYDTSILPYEDCCTVFLPEHPIIKPRIDKVEKEESRLNIEELIAEAMEKEEIVNTKDL
ncbi:MAG TPA: tRNA 4-thiouridine(8) synthase ThiI, partial [Clostridiales bacterium]|nr:tRNA 4-thiouridine(8) synthase ThiI [Clostridiales bacterium]